MKSITRCLVFLLIGLAGVLLAAEAPKPNIVILLADDLGYADVGFTGGKQIKTPHLDTLAAAGARLEQYYVQPVCSPTRGALMTGRYPMRLGLQVGVIRPHEQRGLPLEERILPQALKEAGYTTAIVGKWHLGMFKKEYLPTSRGFDHQYGHYCGALDYFTHEREGGFDWHRNDKECRDEGYSTHLLAKEAVRLINGFRSDQPFFLYVPFNAVHAPHQVPESYKQPYASLPEPRRTYAGMLAAMDEAVGQIHQALDKQGFLKNTLILFSSDNGGPSPGRVTDNGPLRGGKGGLYEGGVRVCAFATWAGQIKPGSRIATPLHAVDWYPTLLNLAGAPAKQKLPLDGQDISTVLLGGTSPEREILLNSTAAAGAIRVGDWKYVKHDPNGAEEDSEGDAAHAIKKKGKAGAKAPPEELFNLTQDPGEQHNLVSENQEKLAELRKRYEKFARQAVKPGNVPQPPLGFKAPRVWGQADGSAE